MENFHVTLPSNASMDVYPDNAVSHYTTRLRQPLDLEGRWEVALVEASLPTRWENVITNQFIRTNLRKRNDPGPFDLDNIEKHLINVEVRAEVKADFYDSPEQLTRALNRAWVELKKKTPKDFVRMLPSTNTAFQYDQIDNVITRSKNMIELDVSSYLGELIGIGDGRNEWLTVPREKNKSNQVNLYMNHMYIYSDIAEYNIVGGTVAPLLRFVQVMSYMANNRMNQYTYTFNKPHYIPVSRTHIESIHIDIRSEQGINIPFVSGKSIVKLHFRRKR